MQKEPFIPLARGSVRRVLTFSDPADNQHGADVITSFSSRSGAKTRGSHGRIRKTIIFIRSVSLMMLWSASFSSSHVIKLREKAGRLNGIARQISFGGSSVFFESSHSVITSSYHVDKTQMEEIERFRN